MNMYCSAFFCLAADGRPTYPRTLTMEVSTDTSSRFVFIWRPTTSMMRSRSVPAGRVIIGMSFDINSHRTCGLHNATRRNSFLISDTMRVRSALNLRRAGAV